GRLRLQDRKDHLLLAHVGGAVDIEIARHVRKLGDLGALQRLEVEYPRFPQHCRIRGRRVLAHHPARAVAHALGRLLMDLASSCSSRPTHMPSSPQPPSYFVLPNMIQL